MSRTEQRLENLPTWSESSVHSSRGGSRSPISISSFGPAPPDECSTRRRPKSFMGSLMLGKTAEQILAMVSKPVLVVHGEPSEDYRHVVAAVDFEIQSRNALREALLLDLVPDNIELIHAFPRGLPTPISPAKSGPATEAGSSEAEISLRFSELLSDLNFDFARARVEMREGPAFTVVSNFLDETGADLVILGCYGKGPLTRRALGSTTMGLLHKAAADVLVAGRFSP
jgi:nucleotide-binding universal stress UspA family protein